MQEIQVLYITTSNGVYGCRERDEKFSLLLGNRHSSGLFRKRAKGFFGICRHEKSNQLILASRERLGSSPAGKKTTDTGLHIFDQQKMVRTDYHEILDVHDVHQIAVVGDLVFLTDTGKNRVHVYDLAARKTIQVINIGAIREDVNHVNAIYADRGQLLVGLNNSKLGESEVVRLDMGYLNKVQDYEIDIYEYGVVQKKPGIQHTHDIEDFDDGFLACASSDGNLISLETGQVLRHIGDWARGIAVGNQFLYVGTSGLASRIRRHGKYKSARIIVLNPKTFSPVKEITVPKAGQLNDLIYENE